MENPSSWKSAEKIIADAYHDWNEAMNSGAVGLSLPATIASRLRKSGHLNDADEEPIGWEGLHEYRR